jgi:hypothetical protein
VHSFFGCKLSEIPPIVTNLNRDIAIQDLGFDLLASTKRVSLPLLSKNFKASYIDR